MKTDKILIIVAMGIEAKPIVKQLGLTELVPHPLDEDLPTRVFHEKINNKDIYLVQSGKCKKHELSRVGTQPASILAWEAIKELNPDLLINAGTAGGYRSKGAEIGDVYLCNEFKYHHRLMAPITNFVPYGVGHHHACEVSQFLAGLTIKKGTVSTGDSITCSKEENLQIFENNATLKDMEAAAIADVAFIKNVPFTAFKAISDIVDINDSTLEQFNENYKAATSNLAKELILFLNNLTENPVIYNH